MVSGHVDGLAELVGGRSRRYGARCLCASPAELARFIAPKGSVALDGVSLTVNEVEGDAFSVLIIPHTLKVTTFGALQPGARLNLEVDQMARYAARLSRRIRTAMKRRLMAGPLASQAATSAKAGPRKAKGEAGKGARILVVEARYYDDIADALLAGATQGAATRRGATFDCISVPGALEIPTAIAIALDAAHAAARL